MQQPAKLHQDSPISFSPIRLLLIMVLHSAGILSTYHAIDRIHPSKLIKSSDASIPSLKPQSWPWKHCSSICLAEFTSLCAARTADVEVAHRAFLVPPHKKRGKGGRQPASDPRLDPNIDERRAKRILANRLSAARSKMKQKNQMDVSLTLYLIMQMLQMLQFLVCREALFKVKSHCA